MALNDLVIELREALEPLQAAEARATWQRALGAPAQAPSSNLVAPFARAESFHAVRESMDAASPRARGRLRSLLGLCASALEARHTSAALEVSRELSRKRLDTHILTTTCGDAPYWIDREPQRERRAELAGVLDRERQVLRSAGQQRLEWASRIAEQLGHPNPIALRDTTAGLDHRAWIEQAASFEHTTREPFRELLAWSLGRTAPGISPAPRGQAEVHDVRHASRAPWIDTWLSREDLLAAVQRWTEELGLGWNARGLRIALDEGPRELPPMAVGLAVPGDVRLAVRRERGLAGWGALLRAIARAQQLAYADGAAPPEDRRLGDLAVRALWPQLFEHLLLEPRWLMRYARVTSNQARELTRFAAFRQLMSLRLSTARLDFNAALLARGSDAGAEEAWMERVRISLGAATGRGDAWAELDPSLAPVHDLRAAALVGPLRAWLQEHFDEDWWRNPAGGRFLIALFARGGRDSVEQLAEELGCAPLSLQPTAARLLHTLEG